MPLFEKKKNIKKDKRKKKGAMVTQFFNQPLIICFDKWGFPQGNLLFFKFLSRKVEKRKGKKNRFRQTKGEKKREWKRYKKKLQRYSEKRKETVEKNPQKSAAFFFMGRRN